MNNKTKIPIISFFTGGGFLDMGFQNAGFKVVFTNEFDGTFADFYGAGMSSHLGCQVSITSRKSIADISPSVIMRKAFGKKIPEVWGIIGGPPCQDFTLNGNLAGFGGERGKMTFLYFQRIRKMKPDFFLMENVIGLMKRKSTREAFETLLNKYIKEEYYLDFKNLNALEYGVPQNRERIFIIGLKKSKFNPALKIDPLYELDFNWPSPSYPGALRYPWPRTNAFQAGNVVKPDGIPDELCVDHCLVTDGSSVPNGKECFALMNATEKAAIPEGDTRRPSFKRLHRYRYSPTTCYGNNEVHLHPYENRRISVREALRIQGVPDDYALPGDINLSKKFKMIGNGVPVPLAEAVAKSLKTTLLACYKTDNSECK